MKLKKWLLGLVTFAAMAVLCAVCAGAENYHAYIGFMTGAYSFRNSFDEAIYGKDVEGGKYFNSVIVWGGNDPETFPQYEDNYDYDIDGYVLPATYTDATISKDGTYTVGISDFDWALDGASSFNLLFISTDIPFNKNAGESIAKFSNAKIIVDGKVTAEFADPFIDTEYGMKTGYTKIQFANIWDNVLKVDGYAGAYPKKSLEIQFDVSFTQSTNFEYYENSDGDTVSITKYIGSESDVVIPEEIDGKSVTAISYGAFSECTDIKSVVIPNSVTSIDSDAFYGCTSLTSITIPNSVTEIGWGTFGKCTSLTSITIPNSVTSIGNGAFANCTSLTSITIPSSVTEIGYYNAFSGCTSLTTINVATGNKNYISVNGVLYNKDKTTIICYPAGKKDKNFKIPDGVTEIADSAFDCCASLTSITIPDSVTVIDDSAFSGCTSLTSIAIPNSVTHIGDGTFIGCTSLTAINVATGAQLYFSVDGVLYVKNLYYEDKTYLICYPAGKKDDKYIVIDGAINIADSAFSGCSNLTSITIPNSVTWIDESAFIGCTSLKSIMIPKSVTSIYDYAFGYDNYDSEYKKIDNFKIYCYSGTAGEQYAKDNGFEYELLEKPTLAKVTGVKLTGRAADALRINWTKNASADGYIVEMYQGNKWVRVAKITNNNTTTFRKAGLKASTVYKFRVKAYKMSGKTALYGNYSATVTSRTNPSVVKGAKLTGRAADALRVNWTKNTTADGYIVEMYKGDKWVRAAKITNNGTTTFRKAGLSASTVYKFRVRAYKMSGKTALYGNYSATVTARTNPSVVKGVKIAGKAKDALRVNWTKNSSAQGYIVEMYKGGKWVRVTKITSNNTTTFRKAGLAKNTTYKFRVKAYYMSGKTALYGNYGSVSGKTAAK